MYYYKQSERVVNGEKYAVTLGEGEKAVQVTLTKDGYTIEKYIQGHGKTTCNYFRMVEGVLWPCGEVMNTAGELFIILSARIQKYN